MDRQQVRSTPRRDRVEQKQAREESGKAYPLEVSKYESLGVYYKQLIIWLAKRGANPVTVEEFIYGNLRRVGLLYILQTQMKTADGSAKTSVQRDVVKNTEHLLSLTKKYRKPSILDVGTEFDEYLVHLKKMFRTSRVNGLNIREDVAGACRYGPQSRKSRDVILYDGNNVPSDLTGFDIINVRMVLHHADDWRSLVIQLFNRLNPGGVLVIVEHDVPSVPDPVQKVCLDVIHDVYDYVINRPQDHISTPLSDIHLIPTEELLHQARSLSDNVVHEIVRPYTETLFSIMTVMIYK